MCDFWIVYENKFEILTEIILYNLEKGKVTELSKLVSASVVTGPVIQESWRGRFHGWPGYLYTHILRNSATPHTHLTACVIFLLGQDHYSCHCWSLFLPKKEIYTVKCRG